MIFVDTNIFIRYFTKDDPEKAEACLALFQAAKNSSNLLTTTEAIIAEVVYVLSSKRLYNLPRGDIRARLYPILTLPGLTIYNRQALLSALDVYVQHKIDFEDALIVAQMRIGKIEQVYSYDRGFDKVAQITRLEPAPPHA